MAIFDKLNEQQKDGVFTTEGPVLILAGAGSGKTGVLTHRIAYLIDELNVNSYNILAITFTNKAAKEMRSRVDNLVGMGADAAWIMTFHAACVRILRRYIDRLGFDTNFSIYDTEDQKNVIKEIVKRKNLDSKQYKEKNILNKISEAKDNLISPDQMYQQSSGNIEKMRIAEIYGEYQEQLKKNNALDFDDIIFYSVSLFRDDKEVLEYYQNRFKYIMVDEYQDTNTAQFHLIRYLAGKSGNLCVVGDDDQSIYKFRGANIKNILNFKEYFPEAKIIKLEHNYRSTQNILDSANAVIKNNFGRMDKKLWTDAGNGDKVMLNIYDTGYDEGRGVAEDIYIKCEDGNYNYSDFAVLYRTNAQSRSIEEKLLEKNIPYKIFGGINFYSRKEIKDILAYLKTIENARDDMAVKRILNIPKRGIGATTADKIQDHAILNDNTFYVSLRMADEISAVKRAAAKINTFVNQIEVLKAKKNLFGIDKLIKEIIDTVGYYEYLEEECEDEEELRDRKENIDELISKAILYEESVDEPTLSDFLEEVALVADIDSMSDDDNVVNLMTVHSAKGLEFPVVYLVGMEDGLFPGYMSITSEDPDDIEEERRLCYVAITRAKKQLIISAAKMRTMRGETKMNKTSRFIREIPREWLLESSASKKGVSSIFNKDYIHSEIRKPGQSVFSSFHKEALNQQIFDKKINEGLDYSEGDRVIHNKFGVGTVKGIKQGGRDYEVTVEFDDVGVKKMFASFAKLTKKQ